jgi:hypothetical protein
VDKQSIYRALAVTGGMALFFYILPRIYEPQRWELHEYDSTVNFIERRWFRPDRIVNVKWRHDEEGELGWCTQNAKGEWYIFLREYIGPEAPD